MASNKRLEQQARSLTRRVRGLSDSLSKTLVAASTKDRGGSGGETGPTGATGATGATGPQGATGATGIADVQRGWFFL